MARKTLWVLLIAVLLSPLKHSSILLAESSDPTIATHKQVRVIRPALAESQVKLNTFAMAPDGSLWLCCTSSKDGGGHLLVYGVEGELARSVAIDFVPQAINFSEIGIPFVAGSGKVARLTTDGAIDIVIDAPNLLSDEELQVKLKQQSEKMVAQMLENSAGQVKRIDGQISALEDELRAAKDKPADERLLTRNENRLKVLKQQKDMLKNMLDSQRTSYEQMFTGNQDVSRVKRSTGIAVAKQDLFVCLPSIEGQGYAIYRLTHDLTEPKSIVDNVSGCCGQLDIQTDGEHVIIAENSAFKVRYVDRDGANVKSFGERAQSRMFGKTSVAGWGSCCNPMNVRYVAGDEILVAESSIGHIKRYSNDGDFLGLVGTAKIAGGCKHVAIARDAKRDWYFMMNTAGNNIAVLVPVAEAQAETEDERDTRLAMEGLGQKLVGAWQSQTADKPANQAGESLAENFDFGQHIANQNRYLKLDLDGHVSRQQPVVQTATAAPNTRSGVGLFSAISSLFSGSRITKTTTTAAATPEVPTRWVAIKQDGDVVHFVLEEDQMRNYFAAIRFIDDNHAEFKWYYGEVSGAPLATVNYERVGEAVCDKANCNQTDCEQPKAASAGGK